MTELRSRKTGEIVEAEVTEQADGLVMVEIRKWKTAIPNGLELDNLISYPCRKKFNEEWEET